MLMYREGEKIKLIVARTQTGAGAFHSTAIEPTGVVWPSGGTPVCGGTEAYFGWAHACRGARTVVDALCSTSALDVASSACFPTVDAAAPQCVVEVDATLVSAARSSRTCA